MNLHLIIQHSLIDKNAQKKKTSNTLLLLVAFRFHLRKEVKIGLQHLALISPYALVKVLQQMKYAHNNNLFLLQFFHQKLSAYQHFPSLF